MWGSLCRQVGTGGGLAQRHCVPAGPPRFLQANLGLGHCFLISPHPDLRQPLPSRRPAPRCRQRLTWRRTPTATPCCCRLSRAPLSSRGPGSGSNTTGIPFGRCGACWPAACWRWRRQAWAAWLGFGAATAGRRLPCRRMLHPTPATTRPAAALAARACEVDVMCWRHAVHAGPAGRGEQPVGNGGAARLHAQRPPLLLPPPLPAPAAQPGKPGMSEHSAGGTRRHRNAPAAAPAATAPRTPSALAAAAPACSGWAGAGVVCISSRSPALP